jgi:hypothetical protein
MSWVDRVQRIETYKAVKAEIINKIDEMEEAGFDQVEIEALIEGVYEYSAPVFKYLAIECVHKYFNGRG